MNNKTLFSKYVNKVDSLKDGNFQNISNELFNGKNTYLRSTKKGSSMFDPTWIDVIEDCLYDLGEIITNPREVTASESSVVPIELAKKVNGESVQHLASHTQYIKDITEAGDVIPAKILSHFNKEELHTYENRFIATFVRRLVLFIEKRYEFIKTTVSLVTKDVLMLRNKSIVNGQEVEIETKITVTKEAQDEVTTAAKEYINRIEMMREYVTFYYSSPFMKEMKNEKDVRKPIIQTNIIKKNPKYRKCFETFTFIENFDSLGVACKVDEQFHSYDEEQRRKINNLLISQYLALEDEDEITTVKENHKTYKPKILTSIDDEEFSYGDLVSGPIEFVRADAGYRKYLKSQIRSDLALHPRKIERDFFNDEYEQKRQILENIKEIEKLLSRKNKELSDYEKEVQKIIARRNKEEAEQARKELESLRKEQQSLLDEKRKLIVQAAKSLIKETKAEQASKKKNEKEKAIEETKQEIVIEDVKEEEKPLEEPIIEEKEAVFAENIEELPVLEENIVQEEIVAEPIEKVEEPVINEPNVIDEMVEETKVEEQPGEPVLEVEQSKEEPEQKEEKEKKHHSHHILHAHKKKEEPLKEEINDLVSDEPKEIKAKKPNKRKEKDDIPAIPGKFIVKTPEGYFVSQGQYTASKAHAMIFDDFNKAKQMKSLYGGKVVKL